MPSKRRPEALYDIKEDTMDDTTPIRRRAIEASDEDLSAVAEQVRSALTADSNDAEHDALVAVAELLDITYTTEEENSMGWFLVHSAVKVRAANQAEALKRISDALAEAGIEGLFPVGTFDAVPCDDPTTSRSAPARLRRIDDGR